MKTKTQRAKTYGMQQKQRLKGNLLLLMPTFKKKKNIK